MIIEDRSTYPGLVRRYSDRRVCIRSFEMTTGGPIYGPLYEQAVDRPDNPVVYTETDVPIQTE